jgi:thiol-disulfide isomerase/thioredoxin
MPTPARTLATFALLTLPWQAFAVKPGEAAPALGMPRLDGAGAKVAVREYRGKVVYVDFWASWCIPCRLSLPTLERLYKQHASRGFVVVGVNKDVRKDDAERFLSRTPVSFVLVDDSDDAAAKAFDVKTMPSGYLVDRKGIVRHVHGGFTKSTADALAEEVEKLLAESP